MAKSEAVASGPVTVTAAAVQHAASLPAAVALAAIDRRPLTYAGLLDQVAEAVADLTAAGVSPGRPIALVQPTGPESATAFLAASALGAAAPLNPSYGVRELEFYLADLEPTAVLVDAALDTPAREVASRLGIAVLEIEARLEAEAGRFELNGGSVAARPVGTRADRAATGAAAAVASLPERTRNEIALVLHTSGTTSRPKQVPLTQGNLVASAGHIARTLALGRSDRCLNVMPLFHIHGLVAAVLAPLVSGGSVVCTPGFRAPLFFDWLSAFRPTWYTAVPTMHQSILSRAAEHGDAIQSVPLRFIRSSSAALPRPVLAELESVFGVPVVEAYGMTEASHQMASNPLPPAVRKPGSVGPAAGPEVAVMDAWGTLLPAGELGEVVIRGANVTAGYARNEEANRTAFVDGWFRTGDQGYLDEDGYLFLTGRLKELINRGGEKVAPSEVEDALLAHPSVVQAAVFAVEHPQLGEDVAAAVVMADGAAATDRQLREWVATRLAYFKAPRVIRFVDAIPKGPTGKLQRIGLAARLGIGPVDVVPAESPHVAPRSPAEEVVAAAWAEVLRAEMPGVHDNFFAAGGDSILATQLVARIRDLLGVELPLLAFFDAPSVAGLAAEVDALIEADEAVPSA